MSSHGDFGELMFKPSKKRNIRAKNIALDRKIFVKLRGEADDNVVARVARELLKFDAYGHPSLVSQVASDKSLPKKLNPLYDPGRDHYDIINVSSKFAPENYVYWLIGLLKHNHKALARFNCLRQSINLKILQGDAQGAKLLLSEVDRISKSWWAIEQTMHVIKELEGGDTKQYILSIPEQFPGTDVKAMVQTYQLLSEGSAISFFISNLNDRMKEYKSSGIARAIQNGTLESCRYLPINFDSSRKVELLYLANEWYESIIDQYVIFKTVVSELVSGNNLSDELALEIKSAAELIGDQELISLVSEVDGVSQEVKAIVEDYTAGKYHDVVARVKQLLKDESEAVFGVIEIYAKCKIYTGALDEVGTFYDILASNLGRLLQCDSKTKEIIDYLVKVCVKFRAESWARSLNFHFVATLKNLYPADKVEQARKAASCLGQYNTPKALKKNYKLVPGEEQIAQIPSHRATRYTPFSSDPDLIVASEYPVVSDYLSLRSSRYIESLDYIKAINFAIAEYLKNNISYIFLPVKELCAAVAGIEKLDNSIFISCLIIYDIYDRENSGAFEGEKKDLFEEMMDFNDTYRPSILYVDKDALNQRDVFFLKNICVPSQLDNMWQYSSNDEVINERVAIIDLLVKRKADDPERLKQEKDSVLESLLSEKLRAKLESGKLFVDVQALESHRKHIYETFFEQASSLKGTGKMVPMESPAELLESSSVLALSEQRALASNTKTELMYSIFKQAVEDFALNENYGLDKYLSAEVRHVVFIAQLRSCFERTHLITNQKDGSYLSNDYWRNHYSYVNKGIIDEIDLALGEFSKEVDSILEEVNERFKVEIHVKDSDNVFNFSPFFRRLVRVSEIAEAANNSQEFFGAIIEYMWELASEGARSAQTLINDYLASKISDAINRLELDIANAKRTVAVLDLLQEVKNARLLFTNEVELVLNWFRFVGTDDSRNLERLGVVLEVAISSFESIYGHKGKELVFTQEKSEASLNYREARALFISVLTALENAFKYGDPESSTTAEHVRGDSAELFRITNKFRLDLDEKPAEIVRREKSKWNDEHSQLSTEEGGSGLYKIYNLLSSASEGFSFDIESKDGNFVAEIGLNYEGFDNRRQSAKA